MKQSFSDGIRVRIELRTSLSHAESFCFSSPQTRWLDALSDGTAGLQTISPCMSVCDLKCDNYFKLVAAEIPFSLDSKPRLRVYKGTQVIHEQMIPGIPSSVQSLYIEETQPKMPSEKVSSIPAVFNEIPF